MIRPHSAMVVLVGLLIVITLAASIVFHDGAKLSLHILMLMGLAALLLPSRQPAEAWPFAVRWVIVSCLVYFASVGLTFLTQPAATDYDWRKLSDYSYVLLILLLFPLLRNLRPPSGYLWWGLVLCAIGSGVYALIEVIQHGLAHRAAGSKGKPIPFGDIAIASAFLSIPALTFFKRYPQPIRYLPWLAFAGGVSAAALSGTRGAYLFLLPGMVVLALLYRERLSRKWFFSTAAAVLAFTALLVSQTTVPERIQVAVQEVQLYLGSDSEQAGSTSLGQRFHMWQVALESFRSSPWTGVGLGQMPQQYKQAFEDNEIPKIIATCNGGTGHTHAHNEYLNTLATRGLLGLGALLMFMLAPLIIFLRARQKASEDQKALANAGILLVAAYAFFGLTDSVLFFFLPANFYLTVIVLITAALSFNTAIIQTKASA